VLFNSINWNQLQDQQPQIIKCMDYWSIHLFFSLPGLILPDSTVHRETHFWILSHPSHNNILPWQSPLMPYPIDCNIIESIDNDAPNDDGNKVIMYMLTITSLNKTHSMCYYHIRFHPTRPSILVYLGLPQAPPLIHIIWYIAAIQLSTIATWRQTIMSYDSNTFLPFSNKDVPTNVPE
jgi:hypothetical protein